MPLTNAWKRMTVDQLVGANAGLRIAHSSPRFQGQALKILGDLIEETYKEMASRTRAKLAEEEKLLRAAQEQNRRALQVRGPEAPPKI